MKNILLAVFLASITNIPVYAQQTFAEHDTDTSTKVFATAEEMPTFNGNLPKWLAKHLRYPGTDREHGTEGKVMLKFIISAKGDLLNPEIIHSSGSATLDAEALRVVKAMPRWKPGRNNGIPINCYFTLPIGFRLA